MLQTINHHQHQTGEVLVHAVPDHLLVRRRADDLDGALQGGRHLLHVAWLHHLALPKKPYNQQPCKCVVVYRLIGIRMCHI
ncbi:Os06g0133100 [Oryza sativa Japonica Group]|uniref:Os06g0133100 protein n=2 Tax=Oryza sativa subsp. japonica TaxID=39947 RepID=A0A0P0WSJ7_ORYSJ|nr:hypothetical protein EE612_031742 [Oryza sativa]BAD67879.1 unknown protein [Oryza sativa Japonica Group]BAF18619.1 Os06g0133100 [Oryza sativa Japonica Group]BAS96000.1 Os06g0133100 [Oryza sativa Japonica Group]|eukprot:NP_001056705.1 Os06g0133100 [Oryza sativa Japonica Group]